MRVRIPGGHANPRGPRGSATPGRGRPTPCRGSRQIPPREPACLSQLPVPAWATLPTPAPPACTAGLPPPPLLGLPTVVTPGGASPQCVLGSCLCRWMGSPEWTRPLSLCVGVVLAFRFWRVPSLAGLLSRSVCPCLSLFGLPLLVLLLLRVFPPRLSPLDFSLTLSVAGLSCGCGVILRAPCGMPCNAPLQDELHLFECPLYTDARTNMLGTLPALSSDTTIKAFFNKDNGQD